MSNKPQLNHATFWDVASVAVRRDLEHDLIEIFFRSKDGSNHIKFHVFGYDDNIPEIVNLSDLEKEPEPAEQ